MLSYPDLLSWGVVRSAVARKNLRSETMRSKFEQLDEGGGDGFGV